MFTEPAMSESEVDQHAEVIRRCLEEELESDPDCRDKYYILFYRSKPLKMGCSIKLFMAAVSVGRDH
jgi:hypothetical protein